MSHASNRRRLSCDHTSRLCSLAVVAVLCLAATAHGAVSYTRVTTGPVVQDGGYSRSANFVDYDNDGWLDISIGNGASDAGVNTVNFLYHNNGNGTFTKITGDTFVTTLASSDGHTWGDYDDDGDLDVFVATWRGQQDLLYRNNGNGTFSRVETLAPTGPFTWTDFAAFVDFDEDADMDLYSSVGFSSPLNNHLFTNNGDGTYTQAATNALIADADRAHGQSWGDYDNDGGLDVFICNVGQNNGLFRQIGPGVFQKITVGSIVNDLGVSIRSCWGDYDNDLDLDLIVANASSQNEFLYRNEGGNLFTKILTDPIATNGGNSSSAAFADIDNDGDLDAFVTNGFTSFTEKNFVYLNNGDGTFTQDLTAPLATDTGWSVGFSFGDCDRDGDLDLVIAKCMLQDEDNALYLNDGNSNSWLMVIPQGSLSNRFAAGTRVMVKATIGGVPRYQMRETASPTGDGQMGLWAHFGLGDATVIDSLVVIFPKGTTIVQTNVAVNQYVEITETVEPPSCCQGTTGNVDGDLSGGVDIGDIQAMVDFLFFGGGLSSCADENDVDVSGGTDIADLQTLLDYVFFGASLPSCP